MTKNEEMAVDFAKNAQNEAENPIYTINIGNYTVNGTTFENRCLSASFGGSGVNSSTIPWADNGNPWDYKYEDGEFVYDVLPAPEVPEAEPSELEKIEAQVMFTALMTDSLLEE